MTHRFRFDRRSAGVLMHLTSLPGPHGSGDLGAGAFAFVDWLADAGQSWWQMLPHTPVGRGPEFSPYSSPSSFAGNPMFVSVDDLVKRGMLDRSDLRSNPASKGVDYARTIAFRDEKLRMAYLASCRNLPAEFRAFVESHRGWLDGWSLFAALRWKHDGAPWTDWPEPFRKASPDAIASAREKLADEIEYHQFVQWLFYAQWSKLRQYAAKRGVGLLGDVPIFAGHDSADVWASQKLFLLDSKGHPKVISGCPPDAFNAKGQVWGHAHYDWPAHARQRFAWWIERFRATYELFDAVRVDHFLGFYRVWAIPFGSKNAVKGRWVLTPGTKLLEAMRKTLGDVPLIAEDLGTVTPQALALRDSMGFPGMRVLVFAFNGGFEHLPHNYPPNSVAYTTTHDCDTVNGYVAQQQGKARRDPWSRDYLRNLDLLTGPGDAAQKLIRTLYASPANTAIVPVQDILGMGSEGRMNVPGVLQGNWGWRVAPKALTAKHAAHLRELAGATQRLQATPKR
jgi:4-alpha-glucanotransferase